MIVKIVILAWVLWFWVFIAALQARVMLRQHRAGTLDNRIVSLAVGGGLVWLLGLELIGSSLLRAIFP